jgi:hypothetical protein
MKSKLAAMVFIISVSMIHTALAQSFAEGWVLVKFKPGTSASSVAATHRSFGSQVIDEIPQIRVQRVSAPRGRELAHAAKYSHNPNVEFAELDYFAEGMSITPNDPYFASWQYGLNVIQTPTAWDITTGSASVIIAIVDTGVDYTHPDLAGKVLSGYDFYDNDNNAMDENHHGTHIAGIIGAVANNGIGIAGITWQNPILPVKVYDALGNSLYSIVAKGIIYATDRGARVINLSLGAPTSNSTLQSAVDYAYNHGVVLAAAAGNNGTLGIVYPAAYPNVIAVGASDGNDQRSTISNYGTELDVIAPDGGFSTCLLGRIESLGGTSMSTAYVSAVCGLILSVNPSLTPTDVMRIIRDSADDKGTIGWDMYTGYGRLNAYKAVVMATATPAPAPPPAVDATPPSVNIIAPTTGGIVTGTGSLSASASDNVAVAKVEFLANGKLVATATSSPFTTTWNSSQASNGQVQLTAKAYDSTGNSAASSPVTITVSNPTVTNYSVTGSVAVGGTMLHTLTLQSSTTVSASLSFSKVNLDLYLLNSSGQVVASSCTSKNPEIILTSALPAGNYTLKVVSVSGKSRYTLKITCTSK